jgi:hypothetical protein
MNRAMGPDQWFWLFMYIVFPLLCIIAFATGSLWLCRCLAAVLVSFIVGSAIYYGIESVLNMYGAIMVGLAFALWLRSSPKNQGLPS